MKEIVIKQSTLKLIVIFLIGIIFTAVCVFIFSSGREEYKFQGALGTIFCGLYSAFLLKNLINPKKILVINEKGFNGDLRKPLEKPV